MKLGMLLVIAHIRGCWLYAGHKKIEVELSSTSGGVVITKWSWAPLIHCTKVPLPSILMRGLRCAWLEEYFFAMLAMCFVSKKVLTKNFNILSLASGAFCLARVRLTAAPRPGTKAENP